MAFKPNYRQQRNDRAHAKEQKKQEKLQRRNEEAAKRKVEREPMLDTDGQAITPIDRTEAEDGQEETTPH